MPQYVDGFVLSIPQDKLAAYKKVATKSAKIWKEHGALEYRECVGDDMVAKDMVAFPKMAKTKPGEVVVFSWVIFKSRKHRDAANTRIAERIAFQFHAAHFEHFELRGKERSRRESGERGEQQGEREGAREFHIRRMAEIPDAGHSGLLK